jgi:DNA-binding transcriptional LysR family regulator
MAAAFGDSNVVRRMGLFKEIEMLELSDIRAFAKIAELKSISRAATVLSIPKSTISRSLARLEAQLGVALIYRSNRRLMLTETGMTFWEHAQRVLETLADAELAIANTGKKPTGLLRIAAPVTLGQFLIAPLIADFMRDFPDIRVSFSLISHKVDMLAEDIDVLFRAGALEDSQLMARRLAVSPLLLVGTQSYIDQTCEPLHPRDLVNHTLIDIQNGPVEWMLQSDAEPFSVRVNPRFMSNDTGAILTVLRNGAGLGWLPEYLCRNALKSGELVHVLKGWRRGEREIHALYLGHRTLLPKVRVFLDFLKSRFEA